jgi:hypothetical protein
VQPTHGSVSINPATGQITYTPNAGMTTDFTDTFTYYIQGMEHLLLLNILKL